MKTYTEEELQNCNRFTLLNIASAAGLPPEICKEEHADIVKRILNSGSEKVAQDQLDRSPLMRLMEKEYERKTAEASQE